MVFFRREGGRKEGNYRIVGAQVLALGLRRAFRGGMSPRESTEELQLNGDCNVGPIVRACTVKLERSAALASMITTTIQLQCN